MIRPKLIGVKKKLDRRDAVRERKALSAAHLERSIEKELIERLKSKAYGDAPLNVNESVWQAVLDRERNAVKDGVELDMVNDETDEDELEEELEDDWGDREFVSDVSGDEDDILSDLEDIVVKAPATSPHKRPKKQAMSEYSYSQQLLLLMFPQVHESKSSSRMRWKVFPSRSQHWLAGS